MRRAFFALLIALPAASRAQTQTPARRSQPAAARADAAPTAGATATIAALPDSALTPSRPSALRDAPDGRTLATMQAGAVLTPLARDRGWVRVRLEGWVAERDLVPADTTLRARLSAADLRADPQGTRGKMVHWDVEFLALQTADPLRRDLAPEEPYMLVRGPGDENALLYIAVPPSLVASVRALPPLAQVSVTARVRNGRSDPVGVPILDLQSFARRRGG
jgi:hypothetical protein